MLTADFSLWLKKAQFSDEKKKKKKHEYDLTLFEWTKHAHGLTGKVIAITSFLIATPGHAPPERRSGAESRESEH